MKAFLALVLIVGVAASQDLYTDKYDNINLDEILNNERLYKKYFDCLTNNGKCTPDGKELKDTIPEALSNGCERCSDKHKAGAEKVLTFLIEKKPEDWTVLEKIYDPEGTYKQKYQADAEKRGFKLE